MIKAREWPVRAMYLLIAAALAISLFITAAPAHRVDAAPDSVVSQWTRVATPTTKEWGLAPESTIISFDVAIGGEVAYAIVYTDYDMDGDESAEEYCLLKSTDSAATWKDITDKVEKEIDRRGLGALVSLVSVACDREAPDFVAVALLVDDGNDGELHVFISNDGGVTFRDTGAVAGLDAVFTFAVSPEVAGERNIAIGGIGGLFRCQAIGNLGTGWEDATAYGTKWVACDAVIASQFAPSWKTDKTILVVTANTTTVLLQSGTWGTTEGWNEDSTVAIPAVTIVSPATIPNISIPWAELGPATAGLTTPLDYSGRNAANRYVWVNVNYLDDTTIVGKIFRVKNTAVKALGQQIEDSKIWLTNVFYLGYISEGKAIAGVLGTGLNATTECCEGVQVYRNDDVTTMDICCLPWEAACKPPTGRGAMAAFYVSPDKAYAVALMGTDSYDEGAWSWSFDDGNTWNQLSLIDTYIDYLSDVAVSPDCNKTMLVSINLGGYWEDDQWVERSCGCDSVWLKAEDLAEAEEYSGKWLRTWCRSLTEYDGYSWGLLRLAPEETTGDTVYLVDYYTDTVYWNELETLACWEHGTATVDHIVDLAVKDKETIYALDYHGDVAMSDDYAVGWHPAVDSKVKSGYTIAVWNSDVLVGGEDGDVSYSDDGGETFTALKNVATTGYVTVAFDSYFNQNDTIYAALDSADGTANGVYRWVIGKSTKWTDLEAEPLESQIGVSDGDADDEYVEVDFTGLVLDRPSPGNPMTSAATGGVLYASYVGYWDGEWFTGVARYLTPAEDIVCKACGDWDYLHVGLTVDVEGFEATPDALKICGCLTADSNSKLFAIDEWDYYDMAKAQTGTVWTFEDCYAKAAPTVKSPVDGFIVPADPCGTCYNVPFSLRWDRQCDACSYDIQIALDEDFTNIAYDSLSELGESYLPAAGAAPSYYVDAILACETTYYWRVRSADAATGQVIHSWWSEPRSVTVAPSMAAGAITLLSPAAGATDVATKNVGFTWHLSAAVDNFDWVLSTNANLSSPVESKTGLNATAYTCTKTLAYDTTYYWQVTAYKDGAAIGMSAVGTFRTMVEPSTPVTPITPTPIWVWVVIAIGAVLVIVVIVLIFRTRRV